LIFKISQISSICVPKLLFELELVIELDLDLEFDLEQFTP
jgi:hypothetical protein